METPSLLSAGNQACATPLGEPSACLYFQIKSWKKANTLLLTTSVSLNPSFLACQFCEFVSGCKWATLQWGRNLEHLSPLLPSN